MATPVCVVGFDRPEYLQIRERANVPVIAVETLPKIAVVEGQLLVQPPNRMALMPVSKMVYHAILEDDLNFITGLALWGGPCFPDAYALMDCRLRLPCLVRALRHTRFGSGPHGYVAPDTTISIDGEHVAKWGNWHDGDDKARFSGEWTSEQASSIEPFFEGEAVRILIIGERAWQVKMGGRDWLKSIHDPNARLMDIDPELYEDTEHIRQALGMDIIGNDYIIGSDGSKHLLEVNHIPNVTLFSEIWEAYRDHVVEWLNS